MKLSTLNPLLPLLILLPPASAAAANKPVRDPAIDLIPSRAWSMIDLEGECAEQACSSPFLATFPPTTTINPPLHGPRNPS